MALSIRTPKILYQGQPDVIDTDLYTVPVNTKATVTSILACNTNSDTKCFSLYLVRNGHSVGSDKMLVKDQKLVGTSSDLGGGIWTMELPIPIEAGDKIMAIQELSGAINILVVGFEEGVS